MGLQQFPMTSRHDMQLQIAFIDTMVLNARILRGNKISVYSLIHISEKDMK